MNELVAAFAAQLREGQQLGTGFRGLELSSPVSSVYVLGLGGSAFGAEVVQNYVRDQLRVPLQINRGYGVPAALGPGSLVIVSSYSGNTEETLEAASEAQKQGGQVVTITSGGELAQWAEAHGFPCLRVPQGYPPRAAVGFSIVLQLYVLAATGLLQDPSPVLDVAIRTIEGFADHALARQTAELLQGQIGAFYAPDCVDSIALRLRQQINENSKRLCWHHTLPEMNHNELVGWEGPAEVLPRVQVVCIRSAFEHPRVALRFELLERLLSEKGVRPPQTLRISAGNRLSELLGLLHLVDWVSVYLAEGEGTEATPVGVIDRLKQSLWDAPPS